MPPSPNSAFRGLAACNVSWATGLHAHGSTPCLRQRAALPAAVRSIDLPARAFRAVIATSSILAWQPPHAMLGWAHDSTEIHTAPCEKGQAPCPAWLASELAQLPLVVGAMLQQTSSGSRHALATWLQEAGHVASEADIYIADLTCSSVQEAGEFLVERALTAPGTDGNTGVYGSTSAAAAPRLAPAQEARMMNELKELQSSEEILRYVTAWLSRFLHATAVEALESEGAMHLIGYAWASGAPQQEVLSVLAAATAFAPVHEQVRHLLRACLEPPVPALVAAETPTSPSRTPTSPSARESPVGGRKRGRGDSPFPAHQPAAKSAREDMSSSAPSSSQAGGQASDRETAGSPSHLKASAHTLQQVLQEAKHLTGTLTAVQNCWYSVQGAFSSAIAFLSSARDETEASWSENCAATADADQAKAALLRRRAELDSSIHSLAASSRGSADAELSPADLTSAVLDLIMSKGGGDVEGGQGQSHELRSLLSQRKDSLVKLVELQAQAEALKARREALERRVQLLDALAHGCTCHRDVLRRTLASCMEALLEGVQVHLKALCAALAQYGQSHAARVQRMQQHLATLTQQLAGVQAVFDDDDHGGATDEGCGAASPSTGLQASLLEAQGNMTKAVEAEQGKLRSACQDLLKLAAALAAAVPTGVAEGLTCAIQAAQAEIASTGDSQGLPDSVSECLESAVAALRGQHGGSSSSHHPPLLPVPFTPLHRPTAAREQVTPETAGLSVGSARTPAPSAPPNAEEQADTQLSSPTSGEEAEMESSSPSAADSSGDESDEELTEDASTCRIQ